MDTCNDNAFELIDKYKRELIEKTNIETSPDEMRVIDNILFRFWQMDWLDKIEQAEKFQWVPVNIRPTTEEDGIDMQEYPLFFDFQLPAVGQNILVSFRDGVH